MISTAECAIVLASFASMVSGSDGKARYGHKAPNLFSLPRHVHSRQATLHAATRFCALLCRFIPDSYAKGASQSGVLRLRRTIFRSPRKPGRMPHAIGARPLSLTPSIHPKLGVTSRHQGLHRCALRRIFRPCLEKGALTRILRRRKI